MRKLLIVFCYLIHTIAILSAQSIDDKFIGFYFPVDFIISLETTKNYAVSEKIIRDTGYTHNFLIVDENKIALTGPGPGWGEEGAPWPVPAWVLKQYRFEYANDMAVIIDGNGNNYRKISDVRYNHENLDMVINTISNYAGEIILHDLIKNNIITIEKNIITIPPLNNEEFTIQTLYTNYYDTDANLILTRGDSWRELWFYLEIKNSEYIIYEKTKKIIWRTKIQ